MLFSDFELGELRDSLRSSPGAGRGPVSVSVPVDLDPLSFVRVGRGMTGWAGFFGMPGGTEIGALGSTLRIAVPGGDDRLDRLWSAIRSTPPDDVPWLVGFSFSGEPWGPEWDGFPAAVAVLPAAAVIRDRRGTRLSVTVPEGGRPEAALSLLEGLGAPAPPELFDAGGEWLESVPAPAEWRSAVEEAVGVIEAGGLSKVVLARSVVVRSTSPAEPFDLTARLRSGYQRCYAYGWQEGEASFLGASPELLVARRGRRVACNPLAGSAARGEGEDDDAALTAGLVSSRKDRSEHDLVVEDMARRLAPFVDGLDVPIRPSVVKMASVQHLSTHLRGELRGDASVLELAGALHPTPAVGGTPRHEALALIDKMEAIDRGWYAGGVGWVDASGDGEVAVALRCGLLRGTDAHLFAGAGIVSGSNPEAELAETRLKFRPLLDLLTAT